MNPFKPLFIFILMLSLLSCGNSASEKKDASTAAPAAATTTVSNTESAAPGNNNNNFALIVGINKYPNLPAKFQLKGCVNDALMMENLIKDVFGYQPSNIKMLLDEDATKANILGQFEEFLIKNATKDSQILFYFSGHGSRTTDDNSDESDGMDETLVTHDSRDPAGKVSDIRDDELEQLLTQLTQKSDNVTIILDCCSSGSGFRGEDATPATAVPRLAPSIGEERSVPNANANDGRTGFLPPNLNYVLVSACKDKEYAYEHNGHGAMTSAINEVIRTNPNITYRAMMYDVYTKVNAEFSTQNPQIEGSRRDAQLFGNLGKIERFVEITSDNNAEKVVLNAGQAHGVTVGSIYAVYKPGTTSTDQESNLLGKIEITALKPFQAAAKVLERSGDIPKNAAAFEIAHQYGDLRMPVLFDLAGNAAINTKVKSAVEKHSNREDLIKSVAANERYDIRVFLDGGSMVLERPDQFPLKKIDAAASDATDQLMDVLTKEARRLNVLQLENKASSLNIEFTVERWEKAEEDAFGDVEIIKPLALETTEEGLMELNEGNIIQLTITNKSTQPVHVYLLDLATDGGVYLRFPAEGAQDSPMPSGENIKSYHMRITPPQGLNVLKVIATTQPTDFFSLTQSGYRSVPTAPKSPMDQLLNLAWGGSRNAEVIKPKSVGDWTSKKLSFMIR